MSVQILRPNGDETDYSVVVTGTNVGMICARATTQAPNTFTDGLRDTVSLTNVYAAVFNSLADMPSDFSTVTGVAGVLDDDDGSNIYLFACVPGANVGPSPGALSYLAVWAIWSDNSVDGPDVAAFYGVSAETTECEVCSGNGSNGNNQLARLAAGKTLHDRGTLRRPTKGDPSAVSLTPKVWYLSVRGMPAADGLDKYIGDYRLELSSVDPSPSGMTTWKNAGDGTTKPSLELNCRTLNPRNFTLSFTLVGSTAIQYTRNIVAWNPSAANLMFLVKPELLDKATPKTVSVVPG